MLECTWSELRIKRELRDVKKEKESNHFRRVTDSTQIEQMSEDTRGTQFLRRCLNIVEGRKVLGM